MTEHSDRGTGEDVGPLEGEIPSELLDYLERSIGGNMRAVAHYDRDTEVVRVNDDLEEPVEDDVIDIIDDLRLQDVGQTRQEGLYGVGSLYCTIRAFDDALVVHFIQGETRGTMISLDPSTAPGLTDFIYEVLGILHEYSEQEIERAPEWTES